MRQCPSLPAGVALARAAYTSARVWFVRERWGDGRVPPAGKVAADQLMHLLTRHPVLPGDHRLGQSRDHDRLDNDPRS
jgi:hypothetical protein